MLNGFGISLDGKRICFLGSGPLPLTALCLARSRANQQSSALNLCNVDKDPRALQLARAVCSKLNHTGIDFRHALVGTDDWDMSDNEYVEILLHMWSNASKVKPSQVRWFI